MLTKLILVSPWLPLKLHEACNCDFHHNTYDFFHKDRACRIVFLDVLMDRGTLVFCLRDATCGPVVELML